MSREHRQSSRRALHPPLIGVAFGAVAMGLLWFLSAVAPILLTLLAAGSVAAAGGYLAASRLRRGPTGGNLAGLYTLIGIVLSAVPLTLFGGASSLTNVQVALFGLALTALSAMGGQLSSDR